MKNILEIGELVASEMVANEMLENGKFTIFCQKCLQLHKSGNWGELPEEDLESNNFALHNGERILSRYEISLDVGVPIQEAIWIITEYNRSVTTLLFPSEY